MDGVDFINRLDDDSLHMVFDKFQTPTNFLPFGQVCRRWNGLMSLFCLQMTTLVVNNFGSKNANRPFSTRDNSVRIDESQLLRLAESTPNIQNLHINLSGVNITTTDANRLGQLWSQVQELDLEGNEFESEVLGNFTRHFPLVTKLKMDVPDNTKVQVFDAIFSNKPNLVDLECFFKNGVERNWFRSCDVPLERFAMNGLSDEGQTLDTLENCCKKSLQTIKVGFDFKKGLAGIRRIFSTFHQLRVVSLYLYKFSVLQNQPILPRLEKLCLSQYFLSTLDLLIEFLRPYPQLKELHLKRFSANDRTVEKIAFTLPNLRSLSFSSTHLTRAGWMNLTALTSLKYFDAGLIKRLSVEDVQAFVGQMPSLQRLTFWIVNENSDTLLRDYSLLLQSIRDDIRSSGTDRQLWVSRDDVLHFLLDSREECTDLAIKKFVSEMNSKLRPQPEHC